MKAPATLTAAITAALLLAVAPAFAQNQPAGGNDVSERLGREALAAQQAGSIASLKETPLAVEQLGDQAIRLSAHINRGLQRAAVPLPPRLAPADEQALARMEGLNGVEFAQSYGQYMERLYPMMIQDLRTVSTSGRPELKQMADRVLPLVQAQLEPTRQVAEAPSESGTVKVPNLPKGLPSMGHNSPQVPPPSTGR